MQSDPESTNAPSIFSKPLTPSGGDRPPRPAGRRDGPPQMPPADFSMVPDQDDGPEDLDDALRQSALERRAGTPQVKWADDEHSPDFAHLLAATHAGLTPQRVFKLTPDALDLIIRANGFRPQGPGDVIVFALRGGVLTQGPQFEDKDFVEIEDKRPNHRDFCCTIGFFDRRNRKLSAYLASTVPYWANMESYYRKMHGGTGGDVNMMPSGCYVFRVNAHGKGRINPALRMTEPDSVEDDALLTVLRTHNDLTFAHDDFWEKTHPFDNIHCAYSFDKFSSSGCLTIQGPNKEGPWGAFQKVLGKLGWNTHIHAVLITGRDAAIATQIIADGRQKDDAFVAQCLGRIRVGSEGPAVAELQKKLGLDQTGYFGSASRIALVNKERELGKVDSDGIYSPGDDAAFGWGILSSAFVSSTDASGLAPIVPGQQGSGSTAGGLAAPGGNVLSASLNPNSLILLPGPDGSLLSADQKALSVPGEGKWRVVPQSGRITFTPEPGFTGTPRPVRYQVSDMLGQSATASLSVTLQPANKIPVLAADSGRTAAGVATVIAVLANDTDVDGTIDPTSVRFATMPQGAVVTADGKAITVEGQGTWSVLGDGSIRFQPVAGFLGDASVTYTAADDKGARGEGRVTVSVMPGTEPPKTADDVGTGIVGETVTIDVLANDMAGRPLGAPPVSEQPKPQEPSPAGGQKPAVTPVTPPPSPALTGIVAIEASQLRRFAPGAKDKYIQALLRNGGPALAEYGINANSMRLCHFMAQIGHESGGFTIENESLNYTTARRLMQVWPTRFRSVEEAQPYLRNEEKLADKVYMGRLGNTQPGDGYRYRGRGLIQITGRESYREMGKKIGVDLETNPDLANDADVALKIAVGTWTRKGKSGRTLNQLADDNKIDPITLQINGGYNGLADRRQRFNAAWSIWGAGGGAPIAPRNPDVVERGDTGPRVGKLQQLLVRAGYLPANEVIDGRFGGNTQKTLMQFQTASKLNVNGIADAATFEALEKAPAIQAAVPDGRRGPAGRGISDRDPSRATPGKRGSHREVWQLFGVLLAICAAAAFALLTTRTQSPDPDSQIELWGPGALLALACVILLGSRIGSGRRAQSAPQTQRPIDVADPASASAPVAPLPSGGAAAAPDPRQLNASLQKLGFDDSYFADQEPIRNMPALPEDVSILPASPDTGAIELHGLAPDDTLGEPATSAAERKAQGQNTAGIEPYRVLDPGAHFVLIAMFGGDNNLGPQVKNDLGEMAAGAARYGNVATLALADTDTGPGSIVEITPSGQLRTLEQLGEIDTGDPETLATFLARALVTYPSARKAIGFWDHGSGVFDETDPGEVLLDRSVLTQRKLRTPARRLLIPRAQRDALRRDPGTRAMLHDNSGGVLTNLEAGRMLRAAFARSGQLKRADILYSDTCLNGMIEVLEELSDYAHCIVASADTEPPAGWDYEEWIRRTAYTIPSAPADWARHAVQAFGTSYQGQTKHYPCTLAAYFADNDVTEAFAALVAVCSNEGIEAFSLLNMARGRSQGYANRDTYDLANFADILAKMTSGRAPRLEAAALALVQACQQARIDSVALGPTVSASQGLAFWFPSSRRSLSQDIATYRRLKFNRLTNWGEYLSKMYQDDGMS